MPAETHSRSGDLSSEDVSGVVLERLAEVLDRDLDDLTPDSRLREDLDADDFALIDAFEAIEEELGERTVGFHLDDEELADVVTVRDLLDCVIGRINGTSGGGSIGGGS